VRTDKRSYDVAGTLFGKRDIRIVEVDGYRVDVEPEGYVLLSRHIDKPGIIGRVGTYLGEAGINIAGMHLGRAEQWQEAVMLLNVDDPIPAPILSQVANLEGVQNARMIEF
jgi:D-3-phosphoglycerate dehydrogenase